MSTNLAVDIVGMPVVATLKRASGEIVIKGTTPEYLRAAQLEHPECDFEDQRQIGPELWEVKGTRNGRL